MGWEIGRSVFSRRPAGERFSNIEIVAINALTDNSTSAPFAEI